MVGRVSEVIAETLSDEVCDTAIGGGFSDLEMEAWAGFLRAHATLVRELDDELTRAHDLPLSSYDVLVQLASTAGDEMRMSQLADAVLLSRSGLSRLVARLVDQGLVERRECDSDGRGAFATLTDEGRRRLEEARETHRGGVRERFLSRLSDAQQRQLGSAWKRILDVA
jgi:DNA-binding MarR family transcriptional regulator